MSRLDLVLALSLLVAAGCGHAASKSWDGTGPVIRPALFDGRLVVAVTGLDDVTREAIDQLDPVARRALFDVRRARIPGVKSRAIPQVDGVVRTTRTQVQFVPREPFLAGVRYRVRFDPGAVGLEGPAGALEAWLDVPDKDGS